SLTMASMASAGPGDGGGGPERKPQAGRQPLAPNGHRAKVVITDYDFGDAKIERAIIEGAGFDLLPAQCKSEEDVIAVARDADAVMCQYCPVGKRAIEAFSHCQVIARCGTGV